jgi:hypothetical protein
VATIVQQDLLVLKMLVVVKEVAIEAVTEVVAVVTEAVAVAIEVVAVAITKAVQIVVVVLVNKQNPRVKQQKYNF